MENEKNKLKTLNYLPNFDLVDHGLIEDDDLAVEIKELRAEAVKWVKELQGEGWDENQIAGWIKHFFNLTEEDLK